MKNMGCYNQRIRKKTHTQTKILLVISKIYYFFVLDKISYFYYIKC